MVRITKAPEERKTEIMDTAEALFMQKGFETVSVNEIIKQIGIAKGTFYYYFSSKEDLLNAVLERYLDTVAAQCSNIVKDDKLSAVDKLRLVMQRIFMPGKERKGFSMNINNEGNALMKLKLNNLFYMRFEDIITSIVGQGIAEDVFDTRYPRDIAQLLLRGIQSYIGLYFAQFGDPQIFKEKLDTIEFVLERILGLKQINLLNFSKQ